MGKRATRQQGRRAQRREEQQQRAEALRHKQRIRRLTTIGGFVAAGLIIALIAVIVIIRNQQPANPAYPVTDAISCDRGEHSDFHIHAHLSIYIDGKPFSIPSNVGIASDQSCLYWLHTHSSDGILHVEAPNTGHDFTIGNFINIWKGNFEQLGYPSQLDSAAGWQASVDGNSFTGDFRTIPLLKHRLITMAYNSPGVQPDTTFNWNGL